VENFISLTPDPAKSFTLPDLGGDIIGGGVENFSGKGDETVIHVDISTLCDSQCLDLGISIDASTTFVNTADLVIKEPNGKTAVSLSDNTQESAAGVVPHQDTELQCNETVSGTVTDAAENPPTQTRGLRKLPRGSHPELWGGGNVRREHKSMWIALRRHHWTNACS